MDLAAVALVASIASPFLSAAGVVVAMAFKRGHDQAKLTSALAFIDEARVELKKIPEIVIRQMQTQEFYERLHSDFKDLREKVYETREEMVSQHGE